MRYNRISADCHLDLIWLPPDLFTSEAPQALKDRMPYVADGPDGDRWWVAKNGVKFGIAGGVGASGTKYVPGKQLRVDVMASTGLYEDGKQGIRRPGDPHLRIKEMDRDGVDAEVIYGILAAAAKLKDIEASNEMVRIYNTWMAEFCRHYPDRHIGLANLPYGDIDAAVAEVHRVAKLGFKGIELSCSWEMEPMWHDQWEPLWAAINEVGIPLHFHTFPSVSPALREKYTGLTQRALMYSGLCLFQMTLANILTALMGRAVFERYRLDPLRARSHGLRVRGPVQGSPAQAEAQRVLAAAVQGDVPVRPRGHQAHRRDGGGDADVGLGLPAPRRRLAGVGEVHQRAVQAPAGRRHPQDDLRERRTLLWPDQLTGAPCAAARRGATHGARCERILNVGHRRHAGSRR
jgi:hypothetical protein